MGLVKRIFDRMHALKIIDSVDIQPAYSPEGTKLLLKPGAFKNRTEDNVGFGTTRWPIVTSKSGSVWTVTTELAPPFGTLLNDSFTWTEGLGTPAMAGFYLKTNTDSKMEWIFGGDGSSSVFVPKTGQYDDSLGGINQIICNQFAWMTIPVIAHVAGMSSLWEWILIESLAATMARFQTAAVNALQGWCSWEEHSSGTAISFSLHHSLLHMCPVTNGSMYGTGVSVVGTRDIPSGSLAQYVYLYGVKTGGVFQVPAFGNQTDVLAAFPAGLTWAIPIVQCLVSGSPIRIGSVSDLRVMALPPTTNVGEI